MAHFSDPTLQAAADTFGEADVLEAIETHGMEAVITECQKGNVRKLLHPFVRTQEGMQKRCDQIEADLWCDAKRIKGKRDENVSAADCLLLAIYRIIALEVSINHQPPAEDDDADG